MEKGEEVKYPQFKQCGTDKVMIDKMPGDEYSTLYVSDGRHAFSISKIIGIKKQNMNVAYSDKKVWQEIPEEMFYYFIANVQERIQLAVDQLTLREEYKK